MHCGLKFCNASATIMVVLGNQKNLAKAPATIDLFSDRMGLFGVCRTQAENPGYLNLSRGFVRSESQHRNANPVPDLLAQVSGRSA